MSRKRYYKSQNQGIQNLVHNLLVQTIVFTSIIVLLGAKSTSAAYAPAEPAIIENQSINVIEEADQSSEGLNEEEITNISNQLPDLFEKNSGQISDAGVKYFSRKNPSRTYFYDDFVKLFLTGPNSEAELSFSFANSNGGTLVGHEQAVTTTNYFIGEDSEKYIKNNPTFHKVTYKDVYPGIDATYYSTSKELKYDLTVQPGVDLKQIEIEVDGAVNVFVNKNNDVVISTVAGSLYDQNLFVYQNVDGKKKQIPAKFVMKSENSYGFATLGIYDPSLPLIIDPLLYSTYLGASSNETGYDIEVDGTGIYIAGSTNSVDFPNTEGTLGVGGSSDIVATKLSSDGSSVLFSTFIGGSNADGSQGKIGIDPLSSEIVLTGQTNSSDFPTTTGAYDETYNNGYDGYIIYLDPTGTAINYSTYIGSNGDDHLMDSQIDPNGGSVAVGGFSYGTTYPASLDAFDSTKNPNQDGIVSIIAPLGTGASDLIYSSYYGGAGNDRIWGVEFNNAGDLVITGDTTSADFPTTLGAYSETLNGVSDGFLAIPGTYSTYIGGSSTEYETKVQYDSANDRYLIGGRTASADFPTTAEAYQGSQSVGEDGFISFFDTTNGIEYSTYLGGSSYDFISSLDYDEINDKIYATLYTQSSNLYANGDSTTRPGSVDGFIAKIDPQVAGVDGLKYGSYIGGTGLDLIYGAYLDGENNLYIIGYTSSTDFPTADPYSATNQGGQDMFITRVNTTVPIVLTVDTVNDTTDNNPGDESCDDGTGACSLRAAIEEINALGEGGIIEFNIDSEDDRQTIALGSTLPTLTSNTTIDATTQPGYDGFYPEILLDGESTVNESIFLSDADNILIQGIEFTRFANNGINVSIGDNITLDRNMFFANGIGVATNSGMLTNFNVSNSVISDNTYYGIDIQQNTEATIQGNYIGTGINGTSAAPNGSGIVLVGANLPVLIGGDVASHANVISGNTNYGVHVSGADDLTINGNYIGTINDGSAALPNNYGIFANSPSTITIGEGSESYGNVISGNNISGIFVIDQNSLDINYNIIGLDGDAITEIPNLGSGGGVLIGGTDSLNFTHNVIGGNAHGLQLSGSDVVGNYTIEDNLFGVNIEGDLVNHSNFDLYLGGVHENTISGNVFAGGYNSGVSLLDSNTNEFYNNIFGTNFDEEAAFGNTIGSLLKIESSTGNIIGSNLGYDYANIFVGAGEAGILVDDSDDTEISFNYFGVDSNNDQNTINAEAGIKFTGDSNNSTATGNLIADDIGILSAAGATGTGNNFLLNNIYGSGLAIDYEADGVTINDADDLDIGFNNLLNFPVITNVSYDANTTVMTIEGTYQGEASSTLTLEFHYDDGDNTNRTLNSDIGTAVINTDPSGYATFSEDFIISMGQSFVVTAIAVDADGNTSEVSDVSDPVIVPRVLITEFGNKTQVFEGYSQAVYWVELSEQPGDDVEIAISSTGGEVTLNSPLTFTTDNWNEPQIVFVTPVDDGVDSGDRTDTIEHSVSSSDPNWNGITAPDVIAYVIEDDITTFTVDSFNDSNDFDQGDGICDIFVGGCSLRAAIEEANALPGRQRVQFNLSGGGYQVYEPFVALPSITEEIIIDGSSQPGFVSQPLIAIDAESATGQSVLYLMASDSLIQGLTLNFSDDDVIIVEGGSNNVIQGNYIGTNSVGSNNDPASNGSGIVLGFGSSGNTIGFMYTGTDDTTRNVISSNYGDGINIFGSDNNMIFGNIIGLSADLLETAANAAAGVNIASSSNNIVGLNHEYMGNQIAGNGGDGILINHGSQNIVLNNEIGNSDLGIGNDGYGIHITGAAAIENVIGGDYPNASNYITNNDSINISIGGSDNLVIGNTIDGGVNETDSGILFNGSNNQATSNLVIGNNIGINTTLYDFDGNVINGNYIGNDGTSANANGIGIILGGGDLQIYDNVISGNTTSGIWTSNSIVPDLDGAEIYNNIIGLNANQDAALPNDIGIQLNDYYGHLNIGSSSDFNVIAGNTSLGIRINESGNLGLNNNYIGTNEFLDNFGNGSDGVFITGDNSTPITFNESDEYPNYIMYNAGYGINHNGDQAVNIGQNVITLNELGGIDLGNDGFTLNDDLDADEGPNDLQNYPVVTFSNYNVGGSLATVNGYIEAEPSTEYEIDTYFDSYADPEDIGQGNIYVGTDIVITDESGYAEFETQQSMVIASGTYKGSAIATNTSTGESSEFGPDPNSVIPATLTIEAPTYTIINNTQLNLTNDSLDAELEYGIIFQPNNPNFDDVPNLEYFVNASGELEACADVDICANLSRFNYDDFPVLVTGLSNILLTNPSYNILYLGYDSPSTTPTSYSPTTEVVPIYWRATNSDYDAGVTYSSITPGDTIYLEYVNKSLKGDSNSSTVDITIQTNNTDTETILGVTEIDDTGEFRTSITSEDSAVQNSGDSIVQVQNTTGTINAQLSLSATLSEVAAGDNFEDYGNTGELQVDWVPIFGDATLETDATQYMRIFEAAASGDFIAVQSNIDGGMDVTDQTVSLLVKVIGDLNNLGTDIDVGLPVLFSDVIIMLVDSDTNFIASEFDRSEVTADVYTEVSREIRCDAENFIEVTPDSCINFDFTSVEGIILGAAVNTATGLQVDIDDLIFSTNTELESNHEFTLTANAGEGGEFESDPTVSFTTSSQTVSETVGTAVITAQLSAVNDVAVTVPFTVSGTATSGAGNDYTITASPITIAAGQTTTNITVTINDDSAQEAAETLVITMGTPTNATSAGTTSHTLTISANDNDGGSGNQGGGDDQGGDDSNDDQGGGDDQGGDDSNDDQGGGDDQGGDDSNDDQGGGDDSNDDQGGGDDQDGGDDTSGDSATDSERPSSPNYVAEVQYERTENDLDNDKDGCSNEAERKAGTNPNIFDSVVPGISDCDVTEILGQTVKLDSDFITVNGGSHPNYEFVMTGAVHFEDANSSGSQVSLQLIDQDNFTIDLGTSTVDANQLYIKVNDVELKDGSYLLIATSKNQSGETIRATDTLTIDSTKQAEISLKNFSGIQFENNKPIGSSSGQVLKVNQKTFAFGSAPRDSKVTAYWNSVLLTSISLSDSSTGTFYVEPREELAADEIHTLILVAENSEDSEVKSVPLVVKFRIKENSSPVWIFIAISLLLAALTFQFLRRPSLKAPVTEAETNVATSSYTGGMIIGVILSLSVVVSMGLPQDAVAYDKILTFEERHEVVSEYSKASVFSLASKSTVSTGEQIVAAPSNTFLPDLGLNNSTFLLNISFKDLTYFYFFGGMTALLLLSLCLLLNKKVQQKVVQSPTTPLHML